MIRRADVEMCVSVALLGCLAVTASLGYLQATLELRRFVPHRYAAYATVILALVHAAFNFKRLFKYAKSRRGSS